MAGTLRAASRVNIRNVVFPLKRYWKTYSTAVEEVGSIPRLAKLEEKSILRITGKDSAKFMQGVITNDISKLRPGGQRSLFSMLLNSQGRVLFDAFIYCVPGETDEYFLECDKGAVDDIIKHLKTYKLRAKVNFEDASKDVEPWVFFSENDCTSIEMIRNENILATKDPRLDHLCIRMIVPWNQSPVDFMRIEEHVVVDSAVYKEHRYKFGIPEGINELSSTKSLPLEYNLALMNGVSFTKGCYIGQELTARTHHTGQIRKRIMPLQLMLEEKIKSYPVFASGSIIKTDSGRSAGSLAIMSGKYGLGLIRLKELSESYFLVVTDINGKELHAIASKPKWWPNGL